MSMPFYVPPEQMTKDRADFARKGIARGRPMVVIEYNDGVLLIGENPGGSLHKTSEIYDRIAFAGVGRFNEFEMLRVAGIRYADLKGYSYERADVTARGLANAYAQTLGQIFTHEMKPYEIEVMIAEIGTSTGDTEIYRIQFDGTLRDAAGFAVMGGWRTSSPSAWPRLSTAFPTSGERSAPLPPRLKGSWRLRFRLRTGKPRFSTGWCQSDGNSAGWSPTRSGNSAAP